jgi:hypothetical protein
VTEITISSGNLSYPVHTAVCKKEFLMKKGPIVSQRTPELAAMKKMHSKHSEHFSNKKTEKLTVRGAVEQNSIRKGRDQAS